MCPYIYSLFSEAKQGEQIKSSWNWLKWLTFRMKSHLSNCMPLRTFLIYGTHIFAQLGLLYYDERDPLCLNTDRLIAKLISMVIRLSNNSVHKRKARRNPSSGPIYRVVVFTAGGLNVAEVTGPSL